MIVVGGTGLYFRALTQGLCEAPASPPGLRAELAALSTGQLRARLEKVDPAMLAHLDVNNPRRLIRAIEVVESTGRSLRAWQEETPQPLVKDFTALWLQRGKEELHAGCGRAWGRCFAQGWVEEVRGLLREVGRERLMTFPGIGYREIGEALTAAGGGGHRGGGRPASA